jgi:hypothetical protein
MALCAKRSSFVSCVASCATPRGPVVETRSRNPSHLRSCVSRMLGWFHPESAPESSGHRAAYSHSAPPCSRSRIRRSAVTTTGGSHSRAVCFRADRACDVRKIRRRPADPPHGIDSSLERRRLVLREESMRRNPTGVCCVWMDANSAHLEDSLNVLGEAARHFSRCSSMMETSSSMRRA